MAETEQLDETTIVEETVEIDPSAAETTDEDTEFDIVLSGQDDAQAQQAPKSNSDYILDRVMKKKSKLEDDNVLLRKQLEDLATPSPKAEAVPIPPDEDDFEDRGQYLQAQGMYQRQMLTDVVSNQLNTQQNGHRIAAAEQAKNDNLVRYAENAAKLKVSDFNEMQDKAFDLLGDDFAKLLATELPEEAPMLLYWMAKNPKDAVGYRDEYLINPGGTTFKMGKLAAKLTIQPKRSKAAQPESKVESGAVGGINEDWIKEWEKLSDSSEFAGMSKTINARRELKKRARAAGFDVEAFK